MKLIAAFFKLIRLPNLFFMALTQVLFQFCIFYPLYEGNIPANDTRNFILLVFASLFIAAGGYIINDYFDINIDEVNKPHRLIVDRVISRRWAIAWHFMLSFSGVVLTALALPVFQKWYLIVANFLCVIVLWFYSTTFKRKLLIGNIIIALLTSWTILVIFFSKLTFRDALIESHPGQAKFFRFAFLYAGFAFIISLIREAVKDVEDREGDARYGCRTMPIVWGINVSKVYTAIWLIILVGVLAIIQAYILQFRWWWAVIYCLIAIFIPLLIIGRKLAKANTTAEFAQLSKYTKLVMLTGIVSMIFFYFLLMNLVILASASPRRKQLLEWAEVPFRIVVSSADESFPPDLAPEAVAIHIASAKAAVVASMHPQETVVAADTIVVLGDTIIGKPVDREDAIRILHSLSGRTHRVITGVVITQGDHTASFADVTDVTFHPIDSSGIEFYVDKYQPFDKAGAYAIQEWIGVTGIKSINGDFYNVMGLPVSRVLHALRSFDSKVM